MNHTQARQLIEGTFTQAFDKAQFREFAINLLNHVDEDKKCPMAVPDAFGAHVKSCQRLGTYKSPQGDLLDVLIVHLTEDYKIERTRTALRDFVAHKLKRGDNYKEAGLVAFVSPDPGRWRFSYVRMQYETVRDPKTGIIKPEERLTPARRFSYLVGEGESCHTAQARFLDLLQDTTTDPTLAQIEDAFSVEAVTKEFFKKYVELFDRINAAMEKLVAKDKTIRDDFKAKGVATVDFSKKLMGQIVFLYFLQKKGWLGVEKGKDWGTGPHDFLRRLAKGEYGQYDNFFNDVLEHLFYDTLATDRGHEAWCKGFKCRIPFLNGGLFEPPGNYDWKKTDIILPNDLFTNDDKFDEVSTGTGVFDVFDRYNFTVNEAEPLEKEVAIDPEMLGKVFENLIEDNRRKGLGAFYTPREIVHYMCQESLINYLDTAVNTAEETMVPREAVQLNLYGPPDPEQEPLKASVRREIVPHADIETFVRMGEQISHYEAVEAKYAIKMPKSIEKHAKALDAALNDITVCDPAVGSGAFPVGMMTEIVRARAALTPYFNEPGERTSYHFKRHAIQNCLYGVDIDPGAVEIAKLRLWLSLVVDEEDVKQIKPLPNLDYKIVVGNSLEGVEKDLFNHEQFKQMEMMKPRFFNETDRELKAKLKEQIDALIHELTHGKVAFDFEIYFSEVFHEKNGFDVCIGNPPYGAVLTKRFKAWARTVFDTASGELDSYLLFVERGAKLLGEKGILAYILPDTWLTLIGAERFRRWVISKFELHKLALLNGMIFDAAVVDTMLLFVVRQNPTTQSHTQIIVARKDQRVTNVRELPVGILRNQIKWLDEHQAQIKVYASLEYEPLLKKLLSNSTRLDQLFNYRAGCKPYELGKGSPPQTLSTLKKKPFTSPVKLGKEWMPLLRGNDVQRYAVVSQRPEWIKYGDCLAAPRSMEVFLGPRILIQAIRNPSLENRIVAAMTSDTFITRINVYSLIPKASCKLDLEVVLAILNSKTMNWLLKKDYGLHTYVITGVLALPIKDTCPNNNLVAELMRCTRRVLLAKQSDASANTSALEREIDELVYALYGLTAEDIKIVEGKT